jgi:hypothetical protein
MFSTFQHERRSDPVIAGVGRAMDGPMDGQGLAPDLFHDVDLAAARPSDIADVIAQHPEGRPNSLPVRQLDPSFKTTIGL